MEGMLKDWNKGWDSFREALVFFSIYECIYRTGHAQSSPVSTYIYLTIWLCFIHMDSVYVCDCWYFYKMLDELYHHIAMITRNANTFEACLRKKAHVCSSSLWRSNCSWPLYPWSGNTILFSPGFIGMKNATPPGPIFYFFFPLLNYSAPWWLWMMFLKHDDLNFRRNVAHRKSHVWNWSAILPGMCTRREASLQEIRCPNGRQMEDMERRGSKLVCLGQQQWRDPEAFTCSFFSWKFGIHLYPFIIVHPFEN